MDLHNVGEWVKAHPLPSAAIAGVGLAGLAAVALRGKGGAKQAQGYIVPNVLTPGVGGSVDNSNSAGGGTGGLPQWLLDLLQQQQTTQPPPPPTTTSTAPTTAPYNPFVTPSPSVLGKVIGVEHITNPLGSAYESAKVNPYYTPSASDYASEIGGGITRTLAQNPGAPAGAYYTVDNTNLGSGAPVPVGSRIPGERYDALGRVIL